MDYEQDEVLYEDEYSRLTSQTLVIKRYFFPFMTPKEVRTRDLNILYFDDQENSKYESLRTWGKSKCNGVYWAVDFRRCLPGSKQGRSNIIVDIDDGVRKGFTVTDATQFLAALRCCGPMSLIMVDNLNI